MTATLDPEEFRRALGLWPTGVMVVTARDGEGGPLGMACNSFTSVSLGPPLVGFFPAKSSSTWPRMRPAGTFCINLLASHHEGVSRAFATKGVDRFGEIEWTNGPAGPRIADAVGWIDCELHDELDTGDHTLVLGRVVALTADSESLPLVFHRGRYSALAASL